MINKQIAGQLKSDITMKSSVCVCVSRHLCSPIPRLHSPSPYMKKLHLGKVYASNEHAYAWRGYVYTYMTYHSVTRIYSLSHSK